MSILRDKTLRDKLKQIETERELTAIEQLILYCSEMSSDLPTRAYNEYIALRGATNSNAELAETQRINEYEMWNGPRPFDWPPRR